MSLSYKYNSFVTITNSKISSLNLPSQCVHKGYIRASNLEQGSWAQDLIFCKSFNKGVAEISNMENEFLYKNHKNLCTMFKFVFLFTLSLTTKCWRPTKEKEMEWDEEEKEETNSNRKKTKNTHIGVRGRRSRRSSWREKGDSRRSGKRRRPQL